MSELSKALQYLADNACIRRDSTKYKRGREQVRAARDPLSCAQKICTGWHREKAQQITSDISDAMGKEDPRLAVDELERVLRRTIGGRIDPTHHIVLGRLRQPASAGKLTRGEFVKLGGELFRMAAYVPEADGNLGWRKPDIRGFRYHPSHSSGYRKKCPTI